jgi:hydroxymethylpyrimidine kinase/phosphomethylpyrimidine kinase/thiamine-phosphate diphosphorylase
MDWVDLLGDEYPLVAIGGIDYDRAQLVLQTGVGSVAMVSAITKAQDFQMETQRLLALFR